MLLLCLFCGVAVVQGATPVVYSAEHGAKTFGRAVAAIDPVVHENVKVKLAEWVQEHPYFAAPPAPAIEALMRTADPSILEKYLGLALTNHTKPVEVDLKQRQEYLLHRLGQLCQASTHLTPVGIAPACAAQLSYIACSVTPLTMGVFGYISGAPNASALIAQNAWLLNYIDSFGKMPAGVTDGYYLWLGEYPECTDIAQHISGNGITLRGQHCSVDLHPMIAKSSSECSPVSATVGVCVPATCSARDVQILIGVIDQPLGSSSLFCQPSVLCHVTEPPIDWSAIAALVLICLILLIVIMATVYDLFIYQPQVSKLPDAHGEPLLENGENGNDKEMTRVKMTRCEYRRKLPWHLKALHSFSIYTNGAHLLSTSVPRHEMAALHGIRFMSMAWIILAHTCLFAVDYIKNQHSVFTAPMRFWFMPINNATLSTDTFLLISGFLLAFHFLKLVKHDGPKVIRQPMFWARYVLSRYIRLTPVYLVTVFLIWALWDQFGDGPMFDDREHSPLLQKCSVHFWHNLLYINNFWPMWDQCAGHTWYLAVNFQLYIIAAPFLVTLYIVPISTSIVLGLGMLVSCIARAWVMSARQLPMAPIATARPDLWYESTQLYDSLLLEMPWMRLAPFAIGLVLAMLVRKSRPSKKAIPDVLTPFIWLAVLAVLVLVIFLPYTFAKTGHFAPVFGLIYCALFRTAWSLAIAGAVYLCLHSPKGTIASFLSAGVWAPLSRLSYSAFIVHPFVILFYFTLNQSPYYLLELDLLYIYWAIMLASYATALVICLLFEVPVRQMQRRLGRSPDYLCGEDICQ